MIKYNGTRFKIYLFYILILLTGVVVGSFIAWLLPAEQCEELVLPVAEISPQNYGDVFLKTFVGCMKPVLFMWISGLCSISVYCNMIAVMYKGGVLGIASAALLKAYGIGKGIAVSVCGILPQYFVFIPVLIYICIATFEFSKSKQKQKRKLINYIIYLIIAIMGCLLTALTDTYVTSLLLRLCMNGE